MKSLLFKGALMLFLCVSSLSTFAQKADAILSKSVVLNSSADEVWSELRQLDRFGELFPNFIAEVWIDNYTTPKVGLQRKCTAPGQAKGTVSYQESIIEFDDEKRFYAYAVSGVPAKDMVNMFKVIDLGYQKSMVVWNSTGWTFIENPQMSEDQFLGFMGAAIDEAMSVLNRKFN